MASPVHTDETVERLLKSHLDFLAGELPHRGTATKEEFRAHRYCYDRLQELGLEPTMESFHTIASAYKPFLLASALLLIIVAVYQTWRTPLMALPALLVSAAAYRELLFHPTWLSRFWPQKTSHNVIARQPPAAEKKRTLVILTHVDSHRTPWIWLGRTTFRGYQLLSTLAMAAFAGLPILMLVPWAVGVRLPAVLWASITAPVALILLLTLQAELSPFTTGANDNASGVALTLQLAKELHVHPLRYCEVWYVFTGAEEVGAHGARAFVQRHGAELSDSVFVVIDNVAGRNTVPCYYEKETMLLPVRYPAWLLRLAREVSEALPQVGARPFAQRGAYTDGSPVRLAGFPCLTIVNHTADGWIPNWHHPRDLLQEVDMAALHKTRTFVRECLFRLDRTAAGMR